MYVFDPVAEFVSGLVAIRQTYRCLIDGQSEFCGEPLPVGTKAHVLAWLSERYKVIGELFVIDTKLPRYAVVFNQGPLSLRSETWLPGAGTIRYLVDVDGIEKMFVLRPVPDALLEWRPYRQLAMR